TGTHEGIAQISCQSPGAKFVPNSIGPGGWGGDWYVWHAPDGLRARAATRLGCMQAGAEKLGVIEASYASAIIGVLSPVSSHCYEMLHFPVFFRSLASHILAQANMNSEFTSIPRLALVERDSRHKCR